MLQIAKFDDKLKKVQNSIIEVTDEYNQTVTERIKEVSLGFIRQVQELDLRYRESQHSLQEVLVKIDKIHDFTRANDQRFEQLQAFTNELRETFEDTQLSLAAHGGLSGGEKKLPLTGGLPRQTLEERLRAQINALEKQVELFRSV